MVEELEREARAEDVVAEIARLARLLDRLLQALVDFPDLAVHVVVAARAAHGVRRDDHPLDQRVRVVAQDVAILERARLALVGIAHEVLLPRELLGHEAPLEPGGKAGAAAAAQGRLLHLRDHRRRRDLRVDDLAQRLVAAARLVVREPPVLAGEARQDDRLRPVVQEFGRAVHVSSAAPVPGAGAGRGFVAQLVDQRVDLLASHRAAHALVVDEQHGCVAAGAHAFAFPQREGAIRRRLAEADAELLLQVLRRLGGALQRARQVGADRDLVCAERLQVVHRVERRDLVYRDGRHAEVLRHEVHRFRGEPALLVLRDRERRHDRRLLLVGRILRDLAVDLPERSVGKHARCCARARLRVGRGAHRSISPNTMSCVPMIATTSAIMCPRDISSSAARCGKPGARIFMRYGLFAPSETM